jgi:hypothetical protein
MPNDNIAPEDASNTTHHTDPDGTQVTEHTEYHETSSGSTTDEGNQAGSGAESDEN